MRVSECILEAFISMSYPCIPAETKRDEPNHWAIDRRENLRFAIESIHPEWFAYLISRERPGIRPLFDSWIVRRIATGPGIDSNPLFNWIDQAMSVCFPAVPVPDPDAFSVESLHAQPISRLNSILYRVGVIECASVLRNQHQRSINRLISSLTEPLQSDFVLAFSHRLHRESLSGHGSRSHLLRILPSSRNPMMLLLRLGIAMTAGCFSSLAETPVLVLCCKLSVDHACDLVRRVAVSDPRAIPAARHELDVSLALIRSTWYG